MTDKEFWDAAFLAVLPFHVKYREEMLEMPNMRPDCVEEAGVMAAQEATKALKWRNSLRPVT